MKTIFTKVWKGLIATGMALILFIIVCLLLEIGTRLFLTVPASSSTVVIENAAYAYHPWSAHRMTPGFEFKHMRINSYGWRGREYARVKAPDTRRVVLLGDSVAFSSFHVAEEATIAGSLEATLKDLTNSHWEVLNMAVPGGTGHIALATLAHEGIHFQPDVVVALNGANDSAPRGLLDPFEKKRPFRTLQWHRIHRQMWRLYDPRTGRGSAADNFRVIMNESAAVRKWLSLTQSRVRTWPQEFKEELLDHFVDSQVAINALAKGSGAVFIQFVQPYLSIKNKNIGPKEREAIKATSDYWGKGIFPYYDLAYPVLIRRMSAAAKMHGFSSVDLSHIFTDEDVFSDHVHLESNVTASFNHPANLKVAKHIANEILTRTEAETRQSITNLPRP